MIDLLFYAAADSKHHPFVCPYILTALETRRNSAVEVLIKDYAKFMSDYGKCLGRLIADFRERILVRNADTIRMPIKADKIRYAVPPQTEAKVIYITDMDFMFIPNEPDPYDWGLSELRRCGSFVTPYLRDNGNFSGVLFAKKVFFDGVANIPPAVMAGFDRLYGDEVFLRKIIEYIDPNIVYDSVKNRKLLAFHLSLNRQPFKETPNFVRNDFNGLLELMKLQYWINYQPFFGKPFNTYLNQYLDYGNEKNSVYLHSGRLRQPQATKT